MILLTYSGCGPPPGDSDNGIFADTHRFSLSGLYQLNLMLIQRLIGAQRTALLIAIATFTPFAAGCLGPAGPTLSQVYGTVMFDGKPVEDGTISFVPDVKTTGPVAGGKITNGDYNIVERGPALGKYKVEIIATRKTGKKLAAAMPAPPGTMVDETEQYIPTNYNSRSELTVEIEPGRNEHSFDLTSK